MKDKVINGIVVKVTETNIVLLCADGKFKNVPRSPSAGIPMMGQNYSHTEKQRPDYRFMKYIAIASVFLFIILAYAVLPFGGKNPAYIVAMDINPGVELTVDKNLRVQEIYGINEDGKHLVASFDVQNSNLYDAIEEIIKEAGHQGYLQSQEALITTTVVPLAEDLKSIEGEITARINSSLKNNSLRSEVSVNKGTREQYNEAKELNISVNKLNLYKELQAKGKVQSTEEVQNRSVRQLREMIKEGPDGNYPGENEGRNSPQGPRGESEKTDNKGSKSGKPMANKPENTALETWDQENIPEERVPGNPPQYNDEYVEEPDSQEAIKPEGSAGFERKGQMEYRKSQ